MNGDRSDTDDSGRNGTGGSASGGTSGGDASGTGTLDDAVDRPEPTYTRAVAEATLRRIVEPLLAEGVERPSLEAGIAAMTPVDEDENE